MSSKELRSQIRTLMFNNSLQHKDDYQSYMTACAVSWHFADSPTGMTTINQLKVANLVHEYVYALIKDGRDDSEEYVFLYQAHVLLHALDALLMQKCKDKGIISADDHGFKDDDKLLKQHEDDFSEWAEELSFDNDEGSK